MPKDRQTWEWPDSLLAPVGLEYPWLLFHDAPPVVLRNWLFVNASRVHSFLCQHFSSPPWKVAISFYPFLSSKLFVLAWYWPMVGTPNSLTYSSDTSLYTYIILHTFFANLAWTGTSYIQTLTTVRTPNQLSGSTSFNPPKQHHVWNDVTLCDANSTTNSSCLDILQFRGLCLHLRRVASQLIGIPKWRSTCIFV